MVELTNEQVQENQTSNTLQELENKILGYISSAPHDRLYRLQQEHQGNGHTKDDPLIKNKFIYTLHPWNEGDKGVIEVQGQHMVYRTIDDEYQRIVQLVEGDKEGNFALTKEAWYILLKDPSSRIDYGYYLRIKGPNESPIMAYSQAKQIKGRWHIEADGILAEPETLINMQNLIKDLVNSEVEAGRLAKELPNLIENYLSEKKNYLKMNRRTDEVVLTEETRRPPLIQNIIDWAKTNPELNDIEVDPPDIESFIKSQQLPYGSYFNNFHLQIVDQTCSITADLEVPVPFVGGSVHIEAELSNADDGKVLTSKHNSITTNSQFLRNQIEQFDINNFPSLMANFLDRQLLGSGLALETITISPNNKLDLKFKSNHP